MKISRGFKNDGYDFFVGLKSDKGTRYTLVALDTPYQAPSRMEQQKMLRHLVWYIRNVRKTNNTKR